LTLTKERFLSDYQLVYSRLISFFDDCLILIFSRFYKFNQKRKNEEKERYEKICIAINYFCIKELFGNQIMQIQIFFEYY